MGAAKLEGNIFQVAAGKTMRSLTANESFTVQIRDVHKVIMNDAYVFYNLVNIEFNLTMIMH